MTDESDGLRPLIEALYRARKPWIGANRDFIVRPHVMTALQSLEGVYCKAAEAQQKQQNMAMYILGMANLASLVTSGKSLHELEMTRQKGVLDVIAKVGWFKVKGSYVWEDATIMRPEELGKHLDKWLPTVPKGAWTLYSKFRIE